MKAATVALVVRSSGESPQLLAILSDDREISLFETAISREESDPLAYVFAHRSQQTREDDEFGDYVEDLLSHPFLRPEIQNHGVQWLKSKIRIERFQKCEAEAAKIIAEYAYQIYQENRGRTDFFLAGPRSKVRIRIFELAEARRPSQAA